MDVLLSDGFLNHFLGAEGHVSRGVEVGGALMEGALSTSPGINVGYLNERLSYGGVLLVFGDLDDPAEGGDHVDVDAAIGAIAILERHRIFK